MYPKKFPVVNVQLSPPYTNKNVVRRISRAIQQKHHKNPVLHIEIPESELNYSWEDLVSNDVPLAIKYPFYVYTNKANPLPPRDTPLRILFTTPAQRAKVEKDIFTQLKQEYGGWVDPIVEFNCGRERLLDRLRERPIHIWHHQGAVFRTDQIKVELADYTIPIIPLLARHASVNAVFLQTRCSIRYFGEIPLLLTLPMDLNSKQTEILLEGFYRRLLTHPIEIAVYLACLDEYIDDHKSDAWKHFKLRGGSPTTELFTGKSRTFPWLKKSEKVKVLFLKANPFSTARLGIEHEFKFVRDSPYIVRSNSLDLVFEPAVQPKDINGLISHHKPEILHFSGHGSKEGYLLFEADEDGFSSAPVSGESLVGMLKQDEQFLKCVVLNSCWSEEIARPIADYIECVIGMREGISDVGAKQFSRQFYEALANGTSVGKSFERARDYLLTTSEMMEIADESLKPQLFHRADSDPYQLFLRRQ